MDEQEIRKAFQKVKEDILSLQCNFSTIQQELKELYLDIQNIKQQTLIIRTINDQAQKLENQALRHINQAHKGQFSTHIVDNSSTGNKGVQAVSQSVSQSIRQIEGQTKQINSLNIIDSKQNLFQNASELINSLDSLKHDIKRKLAQITPQEFLIFSTIYQTEETKETPVIDYSFLSKKLNISESAVRDYVSRLLKKAMPIGKKKVQNKKIHLFITENFKKIAPLATILQIREQQSKLFASTNNERNP